MRLDLIKNGKIIAHFAHSSITVADFIMLLKMGYDIRLSNSSLDKLQAG